MIRSSFVTKGLGLSLLILASVACGDNKPPPANPETPAASDGGADMPGGDSGAAEAPKGDGGATAETPATPPPAAKLDMPAAAAKLKIKLKGKDTDVEIKSDGTVNVGGKPAHKLMGMELQDKDGKGELKVDGDGNIMGSDGSAYAKFTGDDLEGLDGSKFMAGDTIDQVDAKGKKTSLGKAEGVGSAKKATLLVVAFSVWGTKPPAPAAGAKKPGDKPADKKAGDKPADKKAGDKPAGKK